MELHLAVLTPQTWEQYISFFKVRNQPHPQPAEEVIFVQDENGMLVAGALCYPTKGKFLFIEHLAGHHLLTPQQIHETVVFMARIAMAMGSLLGKWPFILASDGVGQAIERAGFMEQPLKAYTAMPGQLPVKNAPASLHADEGATQESPPKKTTPKVRTKKAAVKKKAAKKVPAKKRSKARKKAARDLLA